MSYRYTVLGSGRQGVAIAYDLILYGEAERVVLADLDSARVNESVQRINLMTRKRVTEARTCDASTLDSLRNIARESHVVVSALPYKFNPFAAEAALAEHAHFCDLGGNTQIVLQELELDQKAKETGVSILPDCGLAPGLSNLLAAWAIRQLKKPSSIRVRCGGLPQIPRPPLFYKAVFNLEGLINEYEGEALCLRNGNVSHIPALSECEQIEIPNVGKLEAFVTSGGTSTAPYSFQGHVDNFDYKTLRHVGHYAAMKAFKDLGLFRTQSIRFEDQEIVPRKLLIDLMRPLIDFPEDRDLVVLFVEAEDAHSKQRYRAVLLDEGDPTGSFTAMERTTGFPTAAIAHLQAQGLIAPGACPIERSVPLEKFFDAIRTRGLRIEESSSSLDKS